MKRVVFEILGFALLALSVGRTQASSVWIRYDVVRTGGYEYRYDYSVRNYGSLGPGVAVRSFQIHFDPDQFVESSIAVATSTLSQDWDQSILGSAPRVPAAYDVLALSAGIADGTALAGFSVTFWWLGAGDPGDQPFEIYDPVTFQLLESGRTSRLSEPPQPISLRFSHPKQGGIILSWTPDSTAATWVLQSTDRLENPDWRDVPGGNANPFTVGEIGTRQFYRLIVR